MVVKIKMTKIKMKMKMKLQIKMIKMIKDDDKLSSNGRYMK